MPLIGSSFRSAVPVQLGSQGALRANLPSKARSVSSDQILKPLNVKRLHGFYATRCHSTAPSEQALESKQEPKPSTLEADRLQHVQVSLRRQQEQQSSSSASLDETKALVETAMLAAVSGLAFTLASLLRLDRFLGYFLPMPVIIAAMRSGPAAGRKTMTATCFLLMLILGPFKAVTYLLMHGGQAVCLGSLWRLQANWSVSLTAGSLTRLLGFLGYLVLTSWALNENIYGLLLQNIYSFLDRIGGGAGSTSPVIVAGLVYLTFVIESVIFNCLMHMLYIPLLQGMGFRPTTLPKLARGFIPNRQ